MIILEEILLDPIFY